VIVMRPAAAFTALGASSPFAPKFDGVWGRINEAGIPVVIHAGDSGNSSNGYAVDGFSASFSGGGWAPSISGFKIERAAFEFMITSVFEKLFDRFPNLRLASVENGSDFLPDLLRKVRNTTKKMPGYYQEDPVETFKRHWWINPFWEDDVNEIAEIMGTDHVLFGSDWPHIEGMPEPLDYVTELNKFDDAERTQILLDNVTFLNTPRPL
jgi:predicted TIM-barrel fold metal-dependent hydrolase